MSWEKACCVLPGPCKRQERSRWPGAAASHSKRNHKAQPSPLEKQEAEAQAGEGWPGGSVSGALVSGIADVP